MCTNAELERHLLKLELCPQRKAADELLIHITIVFLLLCYLSHLNTCTVFFCALVFPSLFCANIPLGNQPHAPLCGAFQSALNILAPLALGYGVNFQITLNMAAAFGGGGPAAGEEDAPGRTLPRHRLAWTRTEPRLQRCKRSVVVVVGNVEFCRVLRYYLAC